MTLPAQRRVATPAASSIDDVVAHLADPSIDASRTIKSIAAMDEHGTPVVVLVPGDREAKLPRAWRLFDDADFAAHPDLVRGFLGPVGLGTRVVVDASIPVAEHGWVVGANEPDAHLVDVVAGRDFQARDVGDYVVARAGDRCARCGGPLELVRSVEAAHIFQLGLTYTAEPGAFVMQGATFTAEDGTEQPFWMGCYGFGVSRMIAVLAESFHDEHGLCWPTSSAPFEVHVCSPGAGRTPLVREVADALYAELDVRGHRRALRRPRRLGGGRLRRRRPRRRPAPRDRGVARGGAGHRRGAGPRERGGHRARRAGRGRGPRATRHGGPKPRLTGASARANCYT